MMCVLPSIMQRLRALSHVESHHHDLSSGFVCSESPAFKSNSSGTLLESNVIGSLAFSGISVDMAGVDLQQLLKRLEPSDNARAADRVLFGELLCVDAPLRLALGLGSLGFEVRKDAVRVFGRILRLGAILGAERELSGHLRERPGFTAALLEGIRNQELAPHFGVMLRSCGQHSEVAQLLFAGGLLMGLAEIAGEGGDSRVEVSLEAFAALREMLLTQKDVAAAYLSDNFDGFFTTYNLLLESQNYMVQRQALRLLGDLLLDCCFMKVMVSYVGSEDFLKIHMTLLRDSSRAVQLEAFHVFKLFVGNPRKPLKVHLILYRNQDRIARLLETMASGRYGAETVEEARDVACAVAALRLPQRRAGAVH